jgi:heavy metal sensor kinase
VALFDASNGKIIQQIGPITSQDVNQLVTHWNNTNTSVGPFAYQLAGVSQAGQGNNQQYFFLMTPVQVLGYGMVILAMGTPLDPGNQLPALFITLLLASLATLLIAVIGGYWLAGRALAPVAAMTAMARRITAENLADRLPIENPDDEFGQLASVVNAGLARLEHSFHALRQFTADASHELRTPLTAIRSVGEVGLREHRAENEYREIIGSILEDTDRLATLVDSLLMLSRADAGRIELHPVRVDLRDLAEEVVEDLRVLAEEKRQEITAGGERGMWVLADRETLRRAVVNLVDNAIKYSPEEASVIVRIAQVAGQVRLEVRDSGPGIDRAHLPHVFDRFYRVDEGRSRAAGGTGLGLSIARWAVEANGGSIEVESDRSCGSTFRIVLPSAG